MIRINLLQTKKRSRSRSAPVDGAEKRGAIYVFSLMALVGAVALILYFALDSLQEDTKRVQQKTNEVREKVEQIKKLIDEETLAARRAELDRIRAAKEKVESQRRSPVQVMHELANILTTGISPDYIEEDYRQCQNRDPECALDPSWDGQAIWLESVSERQGGLLEIHNQVHGVARHARRHRLVRPRLGRRLRCRAAARYRRERQQDRARPPEPSPHGPAPYHAPHARRNDGRAVVDSRTVSRPGLLPDLRRLAQRRHAQEARRVVVGRLHVEHDEVSVRVPGRAVLTHHSGDAVQVAGRRQVDRGDR